MELASCSAQLNRLVSACDASINSLCNLLPSLFLAVEMATLMSIAPHPRALAASLSAAICCVCLLTFLKSVFRDECIKGFFGPSGSIVRPAVVSCLVAAALAFVANIAFLFNTRSKLRTLAAAICSKWQPAYFIVTSIERAICRAIVIFNADAMRSSNDDFYFCPLSSVYENQGHAAAFIWNCAILLTGLSTICCDLDADFTPALRRCSYFLLVLCLLVDTIGSYIWGNVASQVEVSVGDVNLLLDNQITSCVTTQTVIALHFLYVSCRSRHGRGWAYASLRFDLDECGRALLNLPEATQSSANMEQSGKATSELTTLTEPLASHGPKNTEGEISNALSKMRLRWLQFQNYHVSRCRVFVIPCVVNTGIESSSDPVFALLRPAFDLRFLRPLQRLADAHPKYYVSFVFFFLAIPNCLCLIFLRDGPSGPFRSIANLVLNSCMVIMFLAVLSSRRHGIDRVAAKYVMSSFRFATCAVLLAQWICLYILEAYNGRIHPVQLAVTVVLALLFLECALLDCSPHFPASTQILISV
jgi:hypothetical protein